MNGGLAIGIGCRLHCSGEAIAALVREALAGLSPAAATLYTIADKQGQSGPPEAARLLALPLRHLSREALAAAMPRVETRSVRAESLFGVASVAEAAALAGAGPDARLIVRRIARGGATCAIAGVPEA